MSGLDDWEGIGDMRWERGEYQIDADFSEREENWIVSGMEPTGDGGWEFIDIDYQTDHIQTEETAREEAERIAKKMNRDFFED